MDAVAPQIFVFIWLCTIAVPSFPNEGDRFAGKGSLQHSMMPVEFPKVKGFRSDRMGSGASAARFEQNCLLLDLCDVGLFMPRQSVRFAVHRLVAAASESGQGRTALPVSGIQRAEPLEQSIALRGKGDERLAERLLGVAGRDRPVPWADGSNGWLAAGQHAADALIPANVRGGAQMRKQLGDAPLVRRRALDQQLVREVLGSVIDPQRSLREHVQHRFNWQQRHPRVVLQGDFNRSGSSSIVPVVQTIDYAARHCNGNWSETTATAVRSGHMSNDISLSMPAAEDV